MNKIFSLLYWLDSKCQLVGGIRNIELLPAAMIMEYAKPVIDAFKARLHKDGYSAFFKAEYEGCLVLCKGNKVAALALELTGWAMNVGTVVYCAMN